MIDKSLAKDAVLVGMSGGVDSSVSVILLKEAGLKTNGLTITPFKVSSTCKSDEGAKSCCNQKSLIDAIDMAERFSIPHYLVEMTETFENEIITNFVDEYMSGRTPNPCVLCNPRIKWKAFIDKADELGIYYVATGHYAAVRYDETLKKKVLCKAKDTKKDQTYFLWRLTSEQIERTIFPLGTIDKVRTREIAAANNLTSKDKPDSQEICFVPDNDYRNFLVDYLKRDISEPGNFVFRGKIIGRHKGFPFYTVGQRKGLNLSYTEPLFVTEIDAKTNEIHLETIDNISKTNISASDIVLSKYENLDEERIFDVKIRYRDPGTPARCVIVDGILKIELLTPKNSIALGQSVVMYEGDDVVGGGIISAVE